MVKNLNTVIPCVFSSQTIIRRVGIKTFIVAVTKLERAKMITICRNDFFSLMYRNPNCNSCVKGSAFAFLPSSDSLQSGIFTKKIRISSATNQVTRSSAIINSIPKVTYKIPDIAGQTSSHIPLNT